MGISTPEMWQEVVDARGGRAARSILADAISFLQGLDGAKGEKGDSGEKGDHGHTGPAVSCFAMPHFWPSTATCKAAIPMLCFPFLQGSPRCSRAHRPTRYQRREGSYWCGEAVVVVWCNPKTGAVNSFHSGSHQSWAYQHDPSVW